MIFYFRKYKKKSNQQPLTQALYEQARALINAGSSIRGTAKAIGFSDTALRKRLKCGQGGSTLGRFRKVFSTEQEEDVVRHCVELDKRFFGLSRPKPKQAVTNLPAQTSSSSDSDYSLHNSSSDLDGLFSTSEDDEDEPGELRVNNFAVVKVQGKTKNSERLYVSRILRVHEDGCEVLFYKRIPPTQRFSETEEEAFVDSHNIFMALSRPVTSTSGRFQNTTTFSNDLRCFSIY